MPLLKKKCDELHTFTILLIVTIFCNLLQNNTMPIERNKLPFGFSWWLLAFTYNLLTKQLKMCMLCLSITCMFYANDQILPQAIVDGLYIINNIAVTFTGP
jgi:hypothetical protein